MTKRYKKSPITEAVIDIRLAASPGRSVESLRPLHHQIVTDYPKRTELHTFVGKFTPGQPPTQDQSFLGFRHDSSDGKYIFQARIDGFTFSRLQPYEHWEPFRQEGHRLWGIYRQYADPLHCVRVAVRYVNRIDLPKPPVKMEDYFRTYPEISSDISQTMSGHVMQLLLPQQDDVMLSLIQASVPPPQTDTVSINLDLDLFKQSETAFATDEQIWQFLDSLRPVRDKVFEACITSKARELFQPM